MIAGSLDSRAPFTTTAGPTANLRAAMQRVQSALHDIGQPLTSIALAMELLTLEDDVEVRQRMLAAARKECSRAIADVTELRTHTTNLLRLAATTEEENA